MVLLPPRNQPTAPLAAARPTTPFDDYSGLGGAARLAVLGRSADCVGVSGHGVHRGQRSVYRLAGKPADATREVINLY